MTTYKLVPAEPTDDFVVLGGERIADHIRCEFGSNGFTAEEAQGIFENAYRTIVEEGPVVQVGPVGKVKTVGGYPDDSEHTVQWLCKHKDLVDGDYLYTAPQPMEHIRSDTLIIEQTEQIAALLAKVFHGSKLIEGTIFRDCENPKAKQCWDVACRIQEELTASDVENAVAEMEDAEQAAQNALPQPEEQQSERDACIEHHASDN